MKLKLDENLGRSAIDLFVQDGHEVETVRSEGLSGADDTVVIAACQGEERCLITLDLDFSNPLVFSPDQYAGIAVLRMPTNPSLQDLLMVCKTLLTAFKQDSIDGKLWSVQRGRVREYRPDATENK